MHRDGAFPRCLVCSRLPERAVVVRGHARTLPADKKEPALKDAELQSGTQQLHVLIAGRAAAS